MRVLRLFVRINGDLWHEILSKPPVVKPYKSNIQQNICNQINVLLSYFYFNMCNSVVHVDIFLQFLFGREAKKDTFYT